jgi:hypothetical protein
MLNIPVLLLQLVLQFNAMTVFIKNMSWNNRKFENLSGFDEIPFRLSEMVNRIRFFLICVLR